MLSNFVLTQNNPELHIKDAFGFSRTRLTYVLRCTLFEIVNCITPVLNFNLASAAPQTRNRNPGNQNLITHVLGLSYWCRCRLSRRIVCNSPLALLTSSPCHAYTSNAAISMYPEDIKKHSMSSLHIGYTLVHIEYHSCHFFTTRFMRNSADVSMVYNYA